jgi:hypothetical protein
MPCHGRRTKMAGAIFAPAILCFADERLDESVMQQRVRALRQCLVRWFFLSAN